MMSQDTSGFDLLIIFNKINLKHFDGFLDPPVLRWNSRLRTSAGRFFPGSRRGIFNRVSVIEVATYLRTVGSIQEAQKHVYDTVAHEMIHYWLWLRRRPYGHTAEFLQKMKQMGAARYNPIPKQVSFKHCYICPNCKKEVLTRRKIKTSACLDCCNRYSKGQFDLRFILKLKLSPTLEARGDCRGMGF